MITVTMDQVINFKNADIFEGVNLPLKVAYKLNKLKKSVGAEADFYRDKFGEIIDEYAKKDEDGNLVFSEDGNQILIQEDKIEECDEKLVALQELTVEIDNCGLTIDDFGDNIECTPESLEALMPFLD